MPSQEAAGRATCAARARGGSSDDETPRRERAGLSRDSLLLIRKLLVLIVLVGGGLWAYRWWINQPYPEPPEFVWTKQPFRGPGVYAEPGEGTPLEYALEATSPEPPAQIPQRDPDVRVALRRPTTTAIRVSEMLNWRKPFTSLGAMTPAELGPWSLRWYEFTGEQRQIGPRRWAQYRREQPKSER